MTNKEASASNHNPTPTPTPYRQIRARYDTESITVYQAYSSEIAEPALISQRLDASPSFSLDRMTWIKPSFMWMMYRSGFSYKDSRQERILALKLTRTCFEWLLSKAKVNHATSTNSDMGTKSITTSSSEKPEVRVQWDPERSLTLGKLDYRSIQVGIGRDVAKEWVSLDDGILEITDVTEIARKMKRFLDEGNLEAAKELLPIEKAYPLPTHLQTLLGMGGC